MSLKLFITVFCLCCPLLGMAQQINPYARDGGAIRAGKVIFTQSCAVCHGGDATGLSGPDLTQLWNLGGDDGFMFRTVRNGVAAAGMPSSSAPDNEIWAVLAYVQSISTVAVFELEDGDSDRGKALFTQHCSQCHRINRRGGSFGPDLTRIASLRSPEAISASIREPNSNMSRRYLGVELVTNSGETIRGIRKAEDAFSIQLMDSTQRLQAFVKTDLRSFTKLTDSMMPTFTNEDVSDAQLDDILQFLGSLLSPSRSDNN